MNNVVTKLVFLMITVLLMSGCASGAQWVRITPPTNPDGTAQDGTYSVNISSGDKCTGPMIISEYIVTVRNGQLVNMNRVSGANAAAGTCGMVITGVAKGLVPSILGYLGVMDRNDAIREDTRARTEVAMSASGGSGPANLIVVENDIDVEIDQSKECGDQECF